MLVDLQLLHEGLQMKMNGENPREVKIFVLNEMIPRQEKCMEKHGLNPKKFPACFEFCLAKSNAFKQYYFNYCSGSVMRKAVQLQQRIFNDEDEQL